MQIYMQLNIQHGLVFIELYFNRTVAMHH